MSDEEEEEEYVDSLPKAPLGPRASTRRAVVYSEVLDPEKIGRDHRVRDVPKSKVEADLLHTYVSTLKYACSSRAPGAVPRSSTATSLSRLFSHLDVKQKQAFVSAMSVCEFPAGEVIIKQGDTGDNFYVIEEGKCSISIERKTDEEEVVKNCGPGESFGELALLYNAPRAATVRAVTDVKTWFVDRVSFKLIMMAASLKTQSMKLDFIKKVPIFGADGVGGGGGRGGGCGELQWPHRCIATQKPYRTRSACKSQRRCSFPALSPARSSSARARAGTRSTWWRRATSCARSRPPATLTPLRSGRWGAAATSARCVPCPPPAPSDPRCAQIALLTSRPRQATVAAKGPVTCLMLDRRTFNRVMGPLEELLRRNLDSYNSYMVQTI